MKRINWNEPRFDKNDLKEVSSVIKTNYVNEGPKTKEVEEKIKKILGVKYVILTVNATAAIYLAIKSDAIIKKLKDFEVIIPDLTMIATATAVNWAGGKPILVDVKSERATLDLNKIQEKITERTSAIVPVHVLGRAVDLDILKKIADKYNLSVIEDAAGALGSKYKGKFLGTFGKVGCFSLQSNKIITCGQGGIIVTDDERYYKVIRRLRDFGRLNNKEFLHQAIGFNLKFNDLSAALAKSQLKKLEIRKRQLLKQRALYEKELGSLKEIKFFKLIVGEVPLWIDCLVKDREKLISFLKSQEIYTRECWPAIHMNPPYRHLGGDLDFPNSTYISNNTLWLPNGPAIGVKEIKRICSRIKEFYKQ